LWIFNFNPQKLTKCNISHAVQLFNSSITSFTFSYPIIVNISWNQTNPACIYISYRHFFHEQLTAEVLQEQWTAIQPSMYKFFSLSSVFSTYPKFLIQSAAHFMWLLTTETIKGLSCTLDVWYTKKGKKFKNLYIYFLFTNLLRTSKPILLFNHISSNNLAMCLKVVIYLLTWEVRCSTFPF